MTGLRIGLLLLVFAVAAGPAGAKGGDVEARLFTDVPLDATPGTTLTVAWKLSLLRDGRRVPVNADGVFVRLVGRSGADTVEGFAAGGAHPTGVYGATVRVPASGIARVEIGVAGLRSDASGTSRADALFPVASAADGGGRDRPSTWVVLLAAGVVAALALADGARRALRPVRRRSGAPDPGAS